MAASSRSTASDADDRERAGRRARTFFDGLWSQGDYWQLETCANTFGDTVGHLLRPWIIRAYRDLFLNVGFALEREDVFQGTKDGTSLEVLMSLFERPQMAVDHDPGAA